MEGSDTTLAARTRAGRALSGGVGAVSRGAARRPAVTLVLLLVATSALGSGIPKLSFEENLLLILPRGQPDTEANLRLPEDFPAHYALVEIVLKADPAKWETWNARLPHRVPPERLQDEPYVGARNVTDEVYLRGLESLLQFLAARAPPDVELVNIGYQTHVKLLNYTNTYNPVTQEFDPESYRLPGTDREGELMFAANWRTVYLSAPKEIGAQTSPTWDATRSIYIFNPRDGERFDEERAGRFMLEAFEEYKAEAAEGHVAWDVFDLDASGLRDARTVADAHQKDLGQREIRHVAPAILLFVVATLYLAFRSFRGVAVAGGVILMGLAWTFGAMGHLGMKLHALNLIVVPLVFGVGIDYSIHLVNAFADHRRRGLPDDEAFRAAAHTSGFPLLLATVTTVAGLGLMVLSPSALIADLGLAAALGLAGLLLVTLTLIPAGLALLGAGGVGRRYRPSRVMPAVAGLVRRHRGAAVALLVVGTLMMYGGSRALDHETFGNPALNFPRGDVVREGFERSERSFAGEGAARTDANIIIVQGDVTRPEVHRYLVSLQAALAASDLTRDDPVSVVDLVKQWQSLKRGTSAALLNVLQEEAQPGSTYPATQEEIRRAFDEMYACECMRVYTSVLLNPAYDMTIVSVDTLAAKGFGEAEVVFAELARVIASVEDERPEDLQVNLGGYTVYSFLFIKHQMPWVRTMAVVTTLLVAALVWTLTRDWRATLVVLGVNVVTIVWWLGVLPALDIGLSVMLTIPLVFITCIGSDYALHLALDLRRTNAVERSFGVTGKAVLFSAVTTFGAFSLFVPMSNLMLRKSMVATSLAIVAMLVVTVLLVPLAHAAPPAAPPEAGREPVAPRLVAARG